MLLSGSGTLTVDASFLDRGLLAIQTGFGRSHSLQMADLWLLDPQIALFVFGILPVVMNR